MSDTVVCALYKFVSLEDYQALRQPLYDAMAKYHIRGTLLLAREGINGTVAGSRQGIDSLLEWLKNDSRFKDIDSKESLTHDSPFKRTKVKLKKEIVTMGVNNIDPLHVVGTYIEPEEWNALISDPDVLLLDTRNNYEVQVGTFKNAINPETTSFREFPAYVAEHLKPEKHKKIAMFCTGGIRCEKSTALLKEQGFEEVYHLKGGILNYLEQVPEEETLWQGECFVFDDRVTVNHHLEKGQYDQCHGCRLPITEADKADSRYQKGVSCPHCFDQATSEQKTRFYQRQKQIELAKQRGEAHMGADAARLILKKRQAKRLLRQENELTNT